MKIKILISLFVMIVAVLFWCISDNSANSDKVQSGEERLRMASDYLKLGGDENKAKAAKLLRAISIDKQENFIPQAYLMLVEIRKSIRDKYPDITEEELSKARGSIGKVLLDKGEVDRGIDVLIEEAWCFSTPAMIMLEILYQYDVEKYPHKDKRILSFFENAAQEGDYRSLFFLGQIYLNGWGIKKDIEKGNRYLEMSEWQERGFEFREN